MITKKPGAAIAIQGNCIDRADHAGCNGIGCNDEDVMYTLNTIDRPAVFDASRRHDYQPYGETIGTIVAHWGAGGNITPIVVQGGYESKCFRKTAHARDASDAQVYEETEVVDTLNTSDISEARTPTLIYDSRGNGNGSICPTLAGDHQNRITDYTAVVVADAPGGESEEIYNPIRRLTPLEAERCQGMPDGWTDIGDWVDSKGKTHKTSDYNRYKAIGNGIATPFWYWLMKRISDHLEDKTLGSLFSGIGSFELLWQCINGDGSAKWSCDVDEFVNAVRKRHFGDEETGETGDWENYIKPRG